MVARISTIKNISKALNYNEQKVVTGQADLLSAQGFLKTEERLTFYDKLEHFRRLQSLNEKVVTNTLHVSLNFDPSERLTAEQLKEIAAAYMEGIGFGKQPFLVYRHEDAGHPHIHIVSTNIRSDGSRISMHNLGRNQSEIARKEIEQRFGLVKAGEEKPSLQPVGIQRVQYGKGAIKQAIANALKSLLNQYNFTSLEQLNALLRGYNLVAIKGEEGSRMDRYRGLQYQVLDDRGEKVGVPIKASSFHSRPTLSFLERRFGENEVLRSKILPRTRQALDWVLQKQFPSLEALEAAVEKEGIHLVKRQNKDGLLYGVTYVDVKNKLVVNGSELGKAYSAKGILQKLDLPVATHQAAQSQLRKPEQPLPQSIERPGNASSGQAHFNNLLEQLIVPEGERDEVAYPFKRKKRKKKRQG